MPTRQEVYAAIDTERDYQDAQRPDRFTQTILPVSGELVCIATYFRKAEDSYTNSPGEAPQNTLEILRKIGAMCIRAMEHHGAPCRISPEKKSMFRRD